MKPVVRPASLDLDTWKQGELYGGSDLSFGKRIGLTRLGASYNEVPPGRSSCPFHNHHAVDEMFVVLEGSGIYRFGSHRHEIGAGDVVGAPAGGPETAHQIVNTGSAVLRYLAISSEAAADMVEYPDSGKFQSISKRPDGTTARFVGRMGDGLDYWDGEPGASAET